MSIFHGTDYSDKHFLSAFLWTLYRNKEPCLCALISNIWRKVSTHTFSRISRCVSATAWDVNEQKLVEPQKKIMCIVFHLQCARSLFSSAWRSINVRIINEYFVSICVCSCWFREKEKAQNDFIIHLDISTQKAHSSAHYITLYIMVDCWKTQYFYH